MIVKSLIAAGTVAASLVAFAPAQQAQAGVDIDIHFGLPGYTPGFYPGYGNGYGYGYGHPVQSWYGAISCHRGKNIVKWNGFNKVKSVDCSLPGYKYTGWKSGRKYLVRVNARGNIAGVNRIG